MEQYRWAAHSRWLPISLPTSPPLSNQTSAASFQGIAAGALTNISFNMQYIIQAGFSIPSNHRPASPWWRCRGRFLTTMTMVWPLGRWASCCYYGDGAVGDVAMAWVVEGAGWSVSRPFSPNIISCLAFVCGWWWLVTASAWRPVTSEYTAAGH